MDSLDFAVVDITRLIASGRALRPDSSGGSARIGRRERRRLQGELRRAAGAYVKTLARSKDGVVDAATLANCRVAAESSMPTALASAGQLNALLDRVAGALDGFAPSRHDLWRLSRIAIHLREGTATLRGQLSHADHSAASVVAKSLGKQLRRALVAYANAAMEATGHAGSLIQRAREAAVARLSARCVDDADLLAWLEADLPGASDVIQQGVAEPLRDLLVDWAARTSRRLRS
ncbi:MAG TPA: hypothetical protein VMU47_10910 [Caldimonas sp.]|nr:hypothetical protein [Caldimonas sp.]